MTLDLNRLQQEAQFGAAGNHVLLTLEPADVLVLLGRLERAEAVCAAVAVHAADGYAIEPPVIAALTAWRDGSR